MNTGRTVYVLKLVALPGIDATRALRFVLKRLIRTYGLKCVDVQEEKENPK